MSAKRVIELLNEYGESKFGDEWWPGNAEPWIGAEKARELAELLEAPPAVVENLDLSSLRSDGEWPK